MTYRRLETREGDRFYREAEPENRSCSYTAAAMRRR
jgi:hypothetical protein